LDRAVKQAPTDAQIAVDRAAMYLAANRLEDAQELCTRLVEIFPDLAKAYEVRAWAGLLLGRGEMAHADAVASLMVSSPWTATRFAQERAAYRVLAGYFTLLQIASPAKAREWVQQWAGLLRKDTWPDVVALSFAAEVDERKALAVAEKLHPEDRGNALGEATVFLALDRYLAENSEGGMRRMQDFFSTRYSAGHTLALVIRERLANKKRRAVLAKFPEKTP
jgi:tetratricopeptide (TPR) repeat protein